MISQAQLVDSHCHVDLMDLSGFDGGVGGVLARARELGVGHVLCASVSLEAFPALHSMALAHERMFASVGLHPNESPGQPVDPAALVELSRLPRVVAIGETGLDYFRSSGDLHWQRERFRHHIEAARAAAKPIIVHSRDARADTVSVLREAGAAEVGGVMHCFVEDWDTARRCMDLGFYISFSGIVTFKNARDLQEVAKRVPLDRLLVETDSPYLAPVPYRGKPNQPGYVRHIAEHIAELRAEPFERIAEATTRNFFTLFTDANPT